MIFDRAVRSAKNKDTGRTTLTVSTADGWTTGIESASKETAMKLSAVNACVEVISNSISKLPVYIMETGTKKHIDHPILKLMQDRPNEAMAPSVFRRLIESNRLLRGNGYALIHRRPGDARPSELIPLDPDATIPYIDDDGKLWYVTTNPKTGEMRKLDNFDVLHYKAFTYDGISGVSVLKRAADVIRNASMAQQYEGNFYGQNARPSGVLTVEGSLEKEAKEKVREEWNKIHSGADKAFRVAVLDNGIKYQQIGVSNADAQFVESKTASIEDIARFFGVPLYKINSGKQSYSSNEQNGIEYVVGTLHPIVTQYEEEDTYKLLFDRDRRKGLEIRRNMMAELRGDSASRATWYKTMRDIGYFSVNDICALEDTPNVPGGDTRNASLNYVPLDLFKELSLSRNKGGDEK